MPKWTPVTFDNIFLNFRLDQITVVTLYSNVIVLFLLLFFLVGGGGETLWEGAGALVRVRVRV